MFRGLRLLCLTVLFSQSLIGQEWHTIVALDRSTFPEETYALMSRTAARVVAVVDEMIPGRPEWRSSNRLTCFVAAEKWTDRPVTLIGQVRKGEPRSSRANRVRIAVTPEVLPGAYQRFAFQLAHELAHVKMDPRIDNKLIETFAVAVSFEVMHRLKYESYLETNQHYYAESLPAEVRAAAAKKEFDKLSLYLRYRWQDKESRVPDYSLQTIGAVLIRSDNNFPWRSLLGIGLKNFCRTAPSPARMQYCGLDESAVPELRTYFEKLGRKKTTKLVVRIAGMTPVDKTSFLFREKGRYVLLREIDSSRPVPFGFVVVP